ncbi:MAG: hypothetical protein HY350_02545 [Candidatus Omnitrophica bacterium]|nr:hypothetical protein [Candidatus Omnitrophota bacterium]
MKKGNGFILVELLTVITINAILPAITFSAEWEMVMPGPHNLREVCFSDRMHGVAAGCPTPRYSAGKTDGSPIAWTEDGGEIWNDSAIDTDVRGTEFNGLWLSSKNTGWAVGIFVQSGQNIFLKTEDSGKTWKLKTPAVVNSEQILTIWFDADGKKGWINPSKGALLKTEDSGETWSKTKFPDITEINLESIQHSGFYAFSFEHVMWVGTSGVFLETKDAGNNWKVKQVPLEGNHGWQGLVAVNFAPDGRNGWAVGGEGDLIVNPNGWTQCKKPVVFHTPDAGLTWERQSVSVITPLYDVWAISKDEAWICGIGGWTLQSAGRILDAGPGTLLHTTDGGKTWRNEHPGVDGLRKIFFIDPKYGWAAGGQSGGGYLAESLVLVYHY